MIKFTRFANLSLMILLVLISLLEAMGKLPQRLAALFVSWPGLLVLVVISLIPWYALQDTAKPRYLRFARGFAAINLMLAIIFCTRIIMSPELLKNQKIMTGMLLIALPALLNFLALNQKQKQFQLAAGVLPKQPARLATWGAYMMAHWRGQLPLAQSFWVNGLGIGNLLAALMVTGLSRLLEVTDASLRMLSAISIVGFVIFGMLWLWAVTGIIRSAGKHAARGGSGWVAGLTMLMVFFSVLAMLFSAQSYYLPQMKEYALLATGHDSMKAVEISSQPNGHVLNLRGTLGEGSMARFAAALEKTPQLKTISLNSPGGRLREAKQMAALLKSRQLNTYVEGECSSACTYVFLAGKDRAATPNAHIGFHQPSFPGIGSTELAIAASGMEKYYRAANLPEDFIRRVLQIQPEGMWYPNREELLKANVVNRVSLGNEGHTMFDLESREEVFASLNNSGIWRYYEKRSPGKIDEVTDLIWNMKLQGKSRPEIQDAVKMATKEVYLRAQKTAPDDLLDEHAQLLTEMLEAARKISPQACGQLIKGTLNTHRTMPEELVKRDTALMEKILASSPRSVSHYMGSKEFSRSASKLQERLSPLQRQVTANLAAYDDQPMFQCDAILSMYRNILRMQDTDRHIILSALMQAK
ncbi:ATP-dependent Clp protease proteolytic subunit [Undibacterium sp. Tian12W]|uniref:ATP-dependent Clp protease proteolytic subunit n=1 Tax=Undibacterium sp. Tian12W TaxID=3413054 RepID=UPI003BF3AD59